jgi:hypothetical protein
LSQLQLAQRVCNYFFLRLSDSALESICRAVGLHSCALSFCQLIDRNVANKISTSDWNGDGAVPMEADDAMVAAAVKQAPSSSNGGGSSSSEDEPILARHASKSGGKDAGETPIER